MGIPEQLTDRPRPAGRSDRLLGDLRVPAGAEPWRRHTLYGLGVLSLMAVCVLASLVVWIVLPSVALRWFPTVVVTGSMRPAVEVGDVVLVRPVEGDELQAPTVVLYDASGTGRVLHRVVARQPDGSYLTKGDANPTPDTAAVLPSQVRGAAVLLIPWVGKPAAWVTQDRWVEVIAAATGLLVCLRLAGFAFDPAYDPWAGEQRVLPVRVLLSVPGHVPDGPASLAPQQLVGLDLRGAVLDRLAAQAAAVRERSDDLLGTRA